MPNSEYHTLGRNLGKPDAIGSGEESGAEAPGCGPWCYALPDAPVNAPPG